MKLYQIADCPYARRARIALAEKQLSFETVIYEAKKRPPELDATSPDAKSPTLFHGDARVWESLVVLEYLEDVAPQPALLPKDAAGRARVRLWMREVDAKVSAAMGPIVKQLLYTPAAERDMPAVEEAAQQVRASLKPWNSRLEGRDFLDGARLTLADIALVTPLIAFRNLMKEQGEIPGELSALRAWHARVMARPSLSV